MNDDERLSALFALPERAPDPAFVARIERAVRAERQAAAARKSAWHRFMVDCAASAAVVTAFGLIWRLVPAEASLAQAPVAPAAAAAALVLALWFAVEIRPAATGR